MISRNILLNGINKVVIASEKDSLSDILRAQLGLTGTKVGCGQGQCGACNVIMNGKLVRSCITKFSRVPEGAAVTTIEGIGTPGGLHPLQIGLDRPRLRPVRILQPRFYRLGQGSPG